MKGYRTVAFNVIMTIVAVITLWNPEAAVPSAEDVTAGIDAVEGAVVAAWGIGNAILRAITTTPIFNKE